MTDDKKTAMADMIEQVQRLSMASRMKAYRQLADSQTVSPELRRELAARVLQYADVLDVFQADIDSFPDGVASVRQSMSRKTVVKREAPGDTDNKAEKEIAAVLDIPAERLLTLLSRLDDCAQEVGYGAPVAGRDGRGVDNGGELR